MSKPKLSPDLVLNELVRRNKFDSQSLLDPKFPAQAEFIKDPAKLKAILATRRAAKSYTAGLYLILDALQNPGTNSLFIARTRESARRILWKDILKKINRKYKLGIKFHETDLTATLPNGSVIALKGVDTTAHEADLLLGAEYRLAIIDEAASHRQNLRHLIYTVLKPAVSGDSTITICLIGTPGNLKRFFWEVTTGQEPGWKVWQWNTASNPYMAKQWAKELAEIERDRPLFKETPYYKQMYLGQWTVDDSLLVYKYSADRNSFKELPPGEYTYVLGCDLGFNDDTSFVIGAYSAHDPTLYIIHTFKKPKMIISAVAKQLKMYMAKYNLSAMVVDPASKQAVEELRQRHGINLVSAKKTEKATHVQFFNDDLIQGKIKVHDTDAQDLVEEWGNLIWNDKKLKLEEHSGQPNHASDACLYLHRFTIQYLAEPAVIKPKPQSLEWYRQLEDELEAQHDRNMRRANTDSMWPDDD